MVLSALAGHGTGRRLGAAVAWSFTDASLVSYASYDRAPLVVLMSVTRTRSLRDTLRDFDCAGGVRRVAGSHRSLHSIR